MIHRLRPLFAALMFALLLGAPATSRAQSGAQIDSLGLPPGSASWSIVPAASCPGDTLHFVFGWCPNCMRLDRAEAVAGVVIELTQLANACDTASCVPDSRAFSLGAHAAGHYQLNFTLIVHIANGETIRRLVPVPFDVSRCGETGNGPLPYVDSVTFAGRDSGRVCAGDSVRVLIRGHFDDSCHSLRRADWILPFNQRPALVRLLVDRTGCTKEVCLSAPIPWQAELTLPPLVAGDWTQPIALFTVSCADTFPREPDSVASVPFTVLTPEQCGAPQPCFIARFPHPDALCDAGVGPDHPAQVTLEVASAVPLAGLQGTLRVTPAALRITALEAVGPAASMHLAWHATKDGAAFVMFADAGAGIPPIPPDWFHWQGAPVLRVTLEQIPGGPAPPPVTYVFPQELLASDEAGHAVSGCPSILTFVYDPRLDVSARICVQHPCDANGDGKSDVRDLVLMVRCLHQSCPDSARFDCDGDGSFALDDVFCCALSILRQHAPPDSNAAHPTGNVAATLGNPRLDGTTLHVPVHVTGARQLASAMMQLRFPSDRFDFVAVTSGGAPSSVLEIHSVEGNELALGYMDLLQLGLVPNARGAFPPLSPDQMDFDLQLTLKPGAHAGGDIELLDAQFAGATGERLAVAVSPSSMPVVPPDHAELSAARPNPFARETRFSVDLPRGAQVRLSIHDLSGRRVATLFDGALPAGRSEFSWNGLIDRGGRAAHGVYFVHLNAGGEIASRKIVVLGGP